MRGSRKYLFVASAALGLAMAAPAVAQEAAAVDAAGPGDIVVTARRVEERLQDVPISITVYNQEQVDDRNITTASDLAIYTPSLTTNNRFGPDKSSFTIRGFSQDGKTAPTVAVYFADVVSIRANSGTGGSNGTGPGSFFDLQNVQVLKGPQGTLFGRNTTGGAILLVPRKPTDRLEGYVEGSIGNYDMRRIQAVLNVPLAETFRVRVGIDRQKRDGYLHNRSGIGPSRFSDVDYFAARGTIVADLTPDLENQFIASYSRSDTNGYLFRISQCNRGTDPTQPRAGRATFLAPLACNQIDRQAARGDGYYDVENLLPDAGNTLSQWQVINTTTWKASDSLTVKNIASYGEFRDRFTGVLGGEFFPLTSGPQTGLPISVTGTAPAPGQYNNIQSAFTEELQLQGTGGRFTWQAGAYLEISKPMKAGDTTYSSAFLNCSNLYAFQCTGFPGALNGQSGLGLIYNRIENRNIGLYAQGTYEFTEQLALTAGARYTMDRMAGDGGRLQLTFPQPNTPRVAGCSRPGLVANPANFSPLQCASGQFVQKSNKPTWVIDVEYKPIPDALLYVKYARGYRQGGVDPSVVALETWRPERVDSYEVGAKASFSGAVRGFFNVAGFYNNFQNQQLAITVVGKPGSGITGARPIVNAGKSRIWGIEADASVTLFDSLSLDAGYAYLNTKLQEYIAPVLAASSPYQNPTPLNVGGDLFLSPHHRLTLTATYTLPLDETIGRISFGATYVYTSSQDTSVPAENPFQRIPATNLLNLNANWDAVAGLPIDLSAFVTNVTDEKYPAAIGNSWRASGYESYLPAMPRMYGLRVRYRFGQD